MVLLGWEGISICISTGQFVVRGSPFVRRGWAESRPDPEDGQIKARWCPFLVPGWGASPFQ